MNFRIKVFIQIIVLVTYLPLRGQNTHFWANSPLGGIHNQGFIYRTNHDGTNLVIAHHFQGGDLGHNPLQDLVLGPDYRLYGMALGGAHALGIIFSISPEDGDFQIHHHFIRNEPSGSLILASNGNLYGFGGAGYGNLFEFEPISGEINYLHTFSREQGRIAAINNRLVEAEPNVLLGVATRGSSIPNEDAGLIFKYDLNSSEFMVLYEFDGTHGFYPESIKPLSEGKFYGVTTGRWGNIFQFNYLTNEVSVLFSFPSRFNGLIPEVLLSKDGRFYGTTGTGGEEGHGSIFRYDPKKEEFTILHSFLEFEGPHIPETPIIEARNGKIYGNTTYVSRANPGIVIFELDRETGSIDYPTLNSGSGGLSIFLMTEIGAQRPSENSVLNVLATKEQLFYPNPTSDGYINLSEALNNQPYYLTDLSGKILDKGVIDKGLLIEAPSGTYVLILHELEISVKVIKE